MAFLSSDEPPDGPNKKNFDTSLKPHLGAFFGMFWTLGAIAWLHTCREQTRLCSFQECDLVLRCCCKTQGLNYKGWHSLSSTQSQDVLMINPLPIPTCTYSVGMENVLMGSSVCFALRLNSPLTAMYRDPVFASRRCKRTSNTVQFSQYQVSLHRLNQACVWLRGRIPSARGSAVNRSKVWKLCVAMQRHFYLE